MFLDTLSCAILRLCDAQNWSYKMAAEHCGLSARYFGDIARRRSAPTIRTLEKLFGGFCVSPNSLLVPSPELYEESFRIPQIVTQCRGYQTCFGYTTYPICPRCKRTVGREYQIYCDRCGQMLCWKGYADAEIIKIHIKSGSD